MCKMMEFGLVGLAPRRKRAGYTQQSLADALGIERARLANWETGAIWPSASWLPKLADLIGCSIDDLFEAPADARAEDGGRMVSAPTWAGSIVAEAGD